MVVTTTTPFTKMVNEMSSLKKQLSSNIIVLFLLNIGNALAYLFQLFIARQMVPTEYGEFNSLNSLMMVLSAASSAVPMITARFIVPAAVQSQGHIRGVLDAGLRIMGVVGLAVVLIGGVAIPWLQDYLHVNDLLILVMVLLICGLTLVYSVPIGVLQGTGRYIPMSMVINSVPGGRLLGAIVLVGWMGMGLRGAILGCLLSCLLAFSLGMSYLRNLYRHPAETIPEMSFTELWNCARPLVLGTTLIVFLGNIDVIFVRHYCEPVISGLYATASIIGRIANLFPGVLISLLFPEVVREGNRGDGNTHILWINLGLTVAIGGGISLLFTLWPQYIIVTLMGESYRQSGNYLGIIAFTMAILAVCNTVFTYLLGRGDYRSLYILSTGSIVFVILVMIYHDSPQTIIHLLLGSLVGVCVIAALRLGRASGKATSVLRQG
ncbi:MAG: hypothetical protein P4L10_00340 [Acidobacteriaceae bacterium]|nr:hypothetical protein [Acidobacteriaceae bacterium]